MTILTADTAEKLKLPIMPSKSILVGPDGEQLSVAGETSLTLASKTRSTEATALVVRGANQNLLGRPEIWSLGMLKQCNLAATQLDSVTGTRFDPVTIFPELFDGLGTMPGIFRINLRENASPFCLFVPRTIPASLRESAKAAIMKMLQEDIIEVVKGPSDWCAALTIVPKPNGKDVRPCVDLTMLNKSVQRESYPLPRITELLASLGGSVMWSKLDANSGFHQCILNPESKLLTTFITPWGRFCFKRMPFGISSGPEYFQRTMESILEGVVCMMNDILVHGPSEAGHWRNLRSVLSAIKRSGMTLRVDKCELGKQEIKFLGHIISREGIKPDPEKIKAITEMSPPTTRKEAHRFIGMVNYLAEFSREIADLLAPINAITGKVSE